MSGINSVNEDRDFSLSDIVDQNRNLPKEYQQLILNEESDSLRFLDTPYADMWYEFANDKDGYQPQQVSLEESIRGTNFFKNKLNNAILIDLGGGTTDTVGSAAEIWNVGTYVNVDRSFGLKKGDSLPSLDSNPVIPVKERLEGTIRKIRVNSDMLEFVTKMKDESGNFTINGIDFQIVGNEAYLKALAKEVVRATEKQGIIFGVNSNLFVYLEEMAALDKAAIRKIDTRNEYGFDIPTRTYRGIFEKI